MKSTQLKKPFFVIILLTLVVFAILTTFIIYNYVKSEKLVICENIAGLVEDQHKTLKVAIVKDSLQGQRLVISESMPYGEEHVIADLAGFRGDVLQIQSLTMNIENLSLAQSCYIRGRRISLFLKIFSPFFEGDVLHVSRIGEVPRTYKRNDVLDIIQKSVWKNIWAYSLDPSNKNTVNVYNIILDVRSIGSGPVQEYFIFLNQDGRMSIKYPYRSNILPSRRNE
jgi:hypothetical protein